MFLRALPSPEILLRCVLAGLLLAGGYGAAWLALYELGQWGVMVGGSWPWFVPAALRLAAFLVAPLPALPLLIAVELLVGALWAHWSLVAPTAVVVLRHLALPAGAALVAVVWRAGTAGRVEGMRGALWLLAAMVLAPAASALSGTLAAAAEVPSVGVSTGLFAVYFVEELAAVLSFTPALLVLAGRLRPPDAPLSERLMHASGVLAACVAVLVATELWALPTEAAVAASLPPVAWAALRFGLPGAALAVAAANSLLVVAAQGGPPVASDGLILVAGFGLALGAVGRRIRRGGWLAPLLLLLAVVPARAEERPWRVVTLAFESDDYDSFRAFRRRLLEDGRPVEFLARSLGGDIRRMPAMIEEIRALRPDLVYTQNTTMVTALVGRGATPDPARYLTDVPVVFSFVSDPVGAGLVAAPAGSGEPLRSRRNVTGTIHVLDEATLLRSLLAYRASVRVAVLYDGVEPSNLWRVEDLKIAARGLRTTLDFVPFRTDRTAATPEGLARLLEGVAARRPDMLYVIPNAGLAPHLRPLFRTAERLRLPTFCALETFIDAGCMAGVMPPLAELGRQTAEMALAILHGRARPGDMAIMVPQRFSFFVNLPVAQRLGAFPSIQILTFARLVDHPPGDSR